MKVIQSDAEKCIRKVIELAFEFALKNVKHGEYIDPVVGTEVHTHYGHTHLAYSLLFSGVHFANQEHEQLGRRILKRVIGNWNEWSKDKEFHHDFNNFALALILELLDEGSPLFRDVESILLKNTNSKHNTINWLPMRVYVNEQRSVISANNQFRRTNKSLIRTIDDAMNSDGGIEDLLPKNLSFNLQYNISTLALLQFLNVNADLGKDLSSELSFVLSKKLPDNDINYMGRGANQLFGWGPWLYLLSSSSQTDKLMEATVFIHSCLSSLQETDSVFLNKHSNTRNLHWDYHYSSVYLAHLLLWTCLAYRDIGSNRVDLKHEVVPRETSGLNKVENEGSGYVTFAGRSKYLAEKGPVICALFFSDIGVFFKGSNGPWPGQFGDKNFSPINHYLHFGLLEMSRRKRYRSRFLRKALFLFGENYRYEIQPLFSLTGIEIININSIEVYFDIDFRRGKEYILNVPVFERLDEFLNIELIVNGKARSVCSELITSNQYESLKVRQYKLNEKSSQYLRITRA